MSKAPYSIQEVRERIERFSRVELVDRPTAFRKLANLTRAAGGPDIFIKRDDLTGLAFGGNKARKLEFIVRDMLDKKTDVVITWASLQSNWCMQTAAAAKKFAIDSILVLFKTYDLPAGNDGNLLLDRILGADIRVYEAEPGRVVRPEQAMGILEDVADEIRAKGLKPYVVPVGGSSVLGDMDRPLGAIGYVEAFAEMLEQARAAGIEPDWVVHPTGSGGTQAGLLTGARALTGNCRIAGISVSDPKGPFSADVLAIARQAIESLDLECGLGPEDVLVWDEYIGEGYGVVGRDAAEVIRLVFQKEGIVLDPVYTSKAMLGLLDLVRRGVIRRDETVVFIHTGGTPVLFPLRDTLIGFLDPSKEI
jgi:D-cysteine desulfhydrase family pyridoxal phosphate-dependent enzyme